jgi:hypothetical protein
MIGVVIILMSIIMFILLRKITPSSVNERASLLEHSPNS